MEKAKYDSAAINKTDKEIELAPLPLSTTDPPVLAVPSGSGTTSGSGVLKPPLLFSVSISGSTSAMSAFCSFELWALISDSLWTYHRSHSATSLYHCCQTRMCAASCRTHLGMPQLDDQYCVISQRVPVGSHRFWKLRCVSVHNLVVGQVTDPVARSWWGEGETPASDTSDRLGTLPRRRTRNANQQMTTPMNCRLISCLQC